MNLSDKLFDKTVKGKIKYYVYRLVDSRNGETFYVGKGKNNRVFSHVKTALKTTLTNELINELINEEELDDTDGKFGRIREICNGGSDVLLIIHRHGMTENEAFEVEAALIDAYPGTTNIMGGFGSNDRGPMNTQQINKKYCATPVIFSTDKCVMINVNVSISQTNLYDAVRYAWRLDPKIAGQSKYVLAVCQGVIEGVFEASEWLAANPVNFPGFPLSPGRWGFNGCQVTDPKILQQYLGKLAPPRKRGESNPIKYSL